MPEVDGPGVVRLFRKNSTPLVGFVTAYDEYAVSAFEASTPKTSGEYSQPRRVNP
jgi:DNA-binding LytR/AlgR family response regulator